MPKLEDSVKGCEVLLVVMTSLLFRLCINQLYSSDVAVDDQPYVGHIVSSLFVYSCSSLLHSECLIDHLHGMFYDSCYITVGCHGYTGVGAI